MKLAPGSTLGRFNILGLVGRGGMGEVWVAEDGSTGERVALKVLGASAGLTRESGQRFERERELLARVRHPGVVRALGALESDAASGLAYFPMELVLGKSLADLLAEHGRFTIVEAVRVLAAIAAALEATHGAGIVHRDVKPSNVLIARGGAVRLSDFGLARALDSSRFTATGSALGTPTYMSPEQCSARETGPATDLYSLGVLAYELLAGSPPFKAENPVALLRLHLEATPRPLRELRPDVPPRLEALVERLLAKEPGKRGGSPREELDAIYSELTLGDADFVKKVTASIERDTVTVAALADTVPPARRSSTALAAAPLLALAALVAALSLRRGESPAASSPPPPPRATVTLRDASVLTGEITAIGTDALSLLENGVAKRVPRDAIRSIEYR